MSNTSTYPLRLPTSVKAAAEKLAKEEGVSLNQFVATDVAEKLSAMNTSAYFAERKERADFEAFRAILTRQGGELPKEGDEPVFSQVVAQDGLPFEVKAPNAATLAAMEEADQGNLPRFGSVQELFDELEKDGEEYRR